MAMSDGLYALAVEKLLGTQDWPTEVDDRELTFREWFRWKVLHRGGDPRITYLPIKVVLSDDSDA